MRVKTVKMMAILLSAVSLLSGCVKEELGRKPATDGTLTISMNIPTPLTVGTYAMNAKQECDIVAVDVLVFHPNGTFLYREKGTGITNGATDNKRFFSVKIKKTHDPSKVSAFVYANVRSVIDEAVEGDNKWIIPNLTTKDEVIAGLVFDLPIDQTTEKQGGKWLVLPGRYTRFPMWGKTAEIDLTAASISIPEISMLRAVAKIDVGLAFPQSGAQAEQEVAAGLTNFFLEEYYLYNASNKLQIAPSAKNLSGSAVTAPSFPPGIGVLGSADAPIAYSRRTYNADGYKSFMSEIYVAEHAVGADNDRPNNLCIVVGGRFGSLKDPITYYRIDMVKSTLSDGVITVQEYLPLLRNHRYKVNITAVHARGYDTPREAFDAMGLNTNMTVVITSQDERVNEIVYDGQYMLGVDKTLVNVDKRSHPSKKIYINTDYPKGWKASSNTTWLTVTTDNGAKDGSWLSYEVGGNTGPIRSGSITVQAGRLFIEIQVIQSNIADLEILNRSSSYAMNGDRHVFTLKSNYSWKARVVNDEYNIVEEFDESGTFNTTSGVNYFFTLTDDLSRNRLLEDKTAEIEFYSENDEFDPESVVIRGLTPFKIAGYEVYQIDQPISSSWHTYANYKTDIYNTNIPQYGVVSQAKPPVPNSCASLGMATEDVSQWRLPTSAELASIAKAINNPVTNLPLYNFESSDKIYYWTAKSPTHYDSNVQIRNAVYVIMRTAYYRDDISYFPKTRINNDMRARCIKKR